MRANDPERVGVKLSIDSSEYLLEFDTLTDDFIRGFECGEIWAALIDEGIDEVSSIVSASNAEMIMRMAEACDFSFSASELSKEEIEMLDLAEGIFMSVTMRRND